MDNYCSNDPFLASDSLIYTDLLNVIICESAAIKNIHGNLIIFRV